MRILIADYSGHPYRLDLSRALALKGHQVGHVLPANYQGPAGDRPADAARVENLELFSSPSLTPTSSDGIPPPRRAMPIGSLLTQLVTDFRPDVVISNDVPLEGLPALWKAARAQGALFVPWLQGLSSENERCTSLDLPLLGRLIASHRRRSELRYLRRSDFVLVSAPDLLPLLVRRRVEFRQINVIENWVPLGAISFGQDGSAHGSDFSPSASPRIAIVCDLDREDHWETANTLARQFPDIGFDVFSYGGAQSERRSNAAEGAVRGIRVQAHLALADILAALRDAELAVALLDPEQERFALPPEILHCIAAGLPLIVAAPPHSFAVGLVEENGMGRVVPVGDLRALLMEISDHMDHPELRRQMGGNARAYAKKAFDVDHIAMRLERLILYSKLGI